MVKDFTKEDIPVLGRLVSISDDNTVANAEQIWDAKQETNQSEINQAVENRLLTIENTSGLTSEYKNILDYFLDHSNLQDDSMSQKVFTNTQISLDNVPFNIQYTDNRISQGRIPVAALTLNSERIALNVTGNSLFNDDVIFSEDITLQNPEDIFFSEIDKDLPQYLEDYVQSYIDAIERASFNNVTTAGLTVSDFISMIDEDSNLTILSPSHLWFHSMDMNLEDLIMMTTAPYIIEWSTVNDETGGSSIDRTKVTEALNNGRDVLMRINNYPEGGPYFNRYGRLLSYNIDVFHNAPLPNTHTYEETLVSEMTFVFCNQTGDPIQAVNCYIDDRERFKASQPFDYIALQSSLESVESAMYEYKQDVLVSGENIKTINGESLLGSGNISITGGGGTGNVVDNNYVHTDNNYTTTEKNKLAGIAAGAEVNVQSNWNETDTSSDAYILNKPTALSAFTNDMQFVTMSDISTVGAITATDIQNWNAKADAATSLSGYDIKFNSNYFEDDETDGLTFTAQYISDHPVKMTQAEGVSEWSTAGDNKVPTVGAVYNKFLTNDDATVVKTTGNQTISGTKTFNAAPVVSGIKASGDNQSGIKIFTTNGSISSLKTINGNSLFGTGNISTTYSNFTSPTNNAPGVAGLVPAPAAGTQDYVLTASGWTNLQTIIDAVIAQIPASNTWTLSNISIASVINQDYDVAMCVENSEDNKKYLITEHGATTDYPICGKITTSGITWTPIAPEKKDTTQNYYPSDIVTDFNLDGILSYDAFSYLVTG